MSEDESEIFVVRRRWEGPDAPDIPAANPLTTYFQKCSVLPFPDQDADMVHELLLSVRFSKTVFKDENGVTRDESRPLSLAKLSEY